MFHGNLWPSSFEEPSRLSVVNGKSCYLIIEHAHTFKPAALAEAGLKVVFKLFKAAI